ncbi:UDP-3-O-(3-hydroxymyristoyl)glucosamine N-acyltransferase [Candidatus Bilamarchaeum dharawalense]|uniref:UDP-3-O-(3-hydroxymyristoyl)glucosamine N-acyltransferase n=1 Tax=Candidatus Bilamarchaeum dharawalense TaxID=2885759 RepID=A0A5E4LPE7_9ARCH|nr:UDP-3-O-(3-hydroxymyristoyl)glucosamine N-acyltransferase [Candidatus Bilamarchaeum dharawalense]
MDFYAHSSAIVEEQTRIGTNTKIWHFAHIRKGADIGKECNIGKSVYIDSNVSIGNNVKIQNFVSVYHGVTIEDDVFVGPSVTFTNDLHPRAWIWKKQKIAKTLIKKGASIGANATIVAGITIGEYAMVGAGAVVTKKVEPYQLVYGNPAKPRGWVCKCGLPVGEQKIKECKHEVK